MTFFVIVHSIMIVCYAGMTYHIWRGWKDNQLEKKLNIALCDSAIATVEDMQKEIDKNEKLVAEAKSQVAMAMTAMEADTSSSSRYNPPKDIDDMLKDPGMLGSIITAIVVKYGDMRIGMSDMMLLDEDQSISIYVDTGSKEMILSTQHNLGDMVSYINFSNPGDDETYH